MRIISGIHRGRIIQPPKNLRARPTTDFAKENLFNVLSSRIGIEGAEVLDLFSGTGSISYEFASRGAASVVSVEINAIHHRYIKETARKFGFGNLFAVKANCFLYLKSCTKRFDIVFADPPYDIQGSETIPDTVFERGLLRPGGWLVFEHSAKMDVSGHPNFYERRVYGSVNFSIFRQPSDREQKNDKKVVPDFGE
ncbi:RsmD family RNA methyltransferase [uncultured Alistipes sp.]|uniref:RsmD family RNA methyltransferase n=1 Tax=uncultured Alistipes sp. TaxID=538949 RepID=UPI00260FB836|nr:RsmD family RNA methyltransferase [uncultured Alistipes sp.]